MHIKQIIWSTIIRQLMIIILKNSLMLYLDVQDVKQDTMLINMDNVFPPKIQ